MSQKNPYWPEGNVPGETDVFCLMNERGEEMPGAPRICFRDGVYFCENLDSTNPWSELIQQQLDRLNALYQKAEKELSE